MFLNFKEFINTLDPLSNIILEGGSFGHMYHPYEDLHLTFSDIKEMIIDSLQGGLNKESVSTEKLDGQAIAVSWKDNQLIASRNKGDRKNSGANALSVQDVIDKFSGRGEISNAFSFAVQDLSTAISKINPKKRDEIFKNGRAFMHLELIYPPTTNVINYDAYKLIFHNTSTYDLDGNEIESSKKAAIELTKAIKEVNADIQKVFRVDPPKIIQFSKNINFEKDKSYFLSKLSQIQKSGRMGDNDTIKDYIHKQYSEFIDNKSEELNVSIENDVLNKLIQRLAFQDKSYNLRMIKKEVEDIRFYNWFVDFEKRDSKEYYKKIIGPIENLFLELGVRVIKLMTGILALDPEGQTNKIKQDLEDAIKNIRIRGSENEKMKLEFQLKKLQSIGGMDAVLPTEGIVFQYKGKTYKLTGGFAPINQILGIIKFMK